MDKQYSDTIRKEMINAIAICTNFLTMLNVIQKLLLDKFDILRKSDAIIPRFTKQSSHNEWHEKEKSSKKWTEGEKSNKRKHDSASDSYSRSNK